ncbi:twin-arginine translocase TatA/TatE family subunit [candidate division KSB1 bacterium]|nr:twin-arginine translocase TatA/TatE family subunit [candidate division KSB1 bacterium]
MFGSLGTGEILIIFFAILMVFGAKRLPEIAKALGRSIHEFKSAMNSTISNIQDVMEKEENREELQSPNQSLQKSVPKKFAH